MDSLGPVRNRRENLPNTVSERADLRARPEGEELRLVLSNSQMMSDVLCCMNKLSCRLFRMAVFSHSRSSGLEYCASKSHRGFSTHVPFDFSLACLTR